MEAIVGDLAWLPCPWAFLTRVLTMGRYASYMPLMTKTNQVFFNLIEAEKPNNPSLEVWTRTRNNDSAWPPMFKEAGSETLWRMIENTDRAPGPKTACVTLRGQVAGWRSSVYERPKREPPAPPKGNPAEQSWLHASNPWVRAMISPGGAAACGLGRLRKASVWSDFTT